MTLKTIKQLISIGLLLALGLSLLPGQALAQGEVTCENDVVAQADDWLSKLADKFYGNVLAFPVIVDATNAKAATDDSYATIENPDIIEVGWKFCVPATEVAQAMLNESVYTPVSAGETASTLVIGLTEDTVTLDPNGAYNFHSTSVHHGIYETLIAFPPGRVDELIPGVAESWTISDDGLVYTFAIAQGHKFSTGRTLTSQDVAFSLNRVKNLKGNPSFLLDNVASIEAVDEQTVVITQAAPVPSLLAKLAFTSLGIIDSEAAKANGATDAENASETDTAEAWLNDNSIGSGPYMLQKWEPKVETILVRNPEYAGAPAAIGRVIFRTLADAAAQKLALEAGDLDVALDISADQVPSLQEDPNITVFEGQSDTVFFLIMNMDPAIGGPIANDLVQDAVRLATDYEGIRLLVGGAAATPVNIMPVHWAYALDPAQAVQRDVAAAKAKLAEAGFPDGVTVDLEYPEFTAEGVSVGTLAQKVQADLAEAGITVNLKPGDIGPALEKYRNGESPFGLWLWGPDFLDPIDRIAFTPGGKVGDRANWDESNASAALVEAVNRAKVATDPAARDQAFSDVQSLMLDESPFVFLVQSGTQVAYNSRIENFVYTGTTVGRVDPYVMSFR
jgi:peptide/nickel transport system substrate-binding protein